EKIVNMNKMAVDQGLNALVKVNVPYTWTKAESKVNVPEDEPEFVRKIQKPMAKMEGDDLPVGAFKGMEDGRFPLGTAAYEKRGIA
ncbi:MAG TPA: hypothetical protein DD426_10875, partial [Clostridiaceae bacterium]|nr:hypothetical protein [Clostridiaceae bacterium]